MNSHQHEGDVGIDGGRVGRKGEDIQSNASHSVLAAALRNVLPSRARACIAYCPLELGISPLIEKAIDLASPVVRAEVVVPLLERGRRI